MKNVAVLSVKPTTWRRKTLNNPTAVQIFKFKVNSLFIDLEVAW